MIIDNRQVCDVCHNSIHMWPGQYRQNSPMLHTPLWKQCLKYYDINYYENKHQFLCDKCMEKALKRKITIDDLRPCPLSNDWAIANLGVCISKDITLMKNIW